MSDNPNDTDRLDAELALLQAMYPETLSFHLQRRELSYHHEDAVSTSSRLLLRIPSGYPSAASPEVLLATGNGGRDDLRDDLSQALRSITSVKGEECLDAVLNCFDDIVFSAATGTGTADPVDDGAREPLSLVTKPDRNSAAADKDIHTRIQQPPPEILTVIIWLHHLLSTTKRKHALHPPGPSTSTSTSTPTPHHHPHPSTGVTKPRISGLTKPGTPGVMIFSGPSNLVTAHVASLKAMRWQAFQVRYEHQDSDESVEHHRGGHRRDGEKGQGGWKFQHGDGVVEVESMADVVADIVGDDHKKMFLGVMKIR